MDWNSNVVWRYDDPMIHHDFVRMDNGNSVLLLFEPLDPSTANNVQGGYPSDDDPETILGDLIREVDSKGHTIREWKISESLSFEDDVICPLEHRREWSHGNSLNLTPQGDFLVSFRNISTIGIIGRLSLIHI